MHVPRYLFAMGENLNAKRRRQSAPLGGRIGYFKGSDDTPLRYGAWSPQGENGRGTIVFLNGRSEFIEKHFETYADFSERGYHIATMDWRGQGLSGRMTKNPYKDHQMSFDLRRADLSVFLKSIVKPKLPGPYFVVGHSLGAHMIFHNLHDQPGFFEKAVCLAPMMGIAQVPLPDWMMRAWENIMCGLGLGHVYLPGQGDYGPKRRSLERADYLTSDIERYRDEEAAVDLNPDLAMGGITYGWLRAARRSHERLQSPGFAEAIQTPALILCAGADRVVDNEDIRQFASRMPHAHYECIAGARHELLKERDELRSQAMGKIMRFLKGSGGQ